MIIWDTPYRIKVELFNKMVVIQGEALAGGQGFILYANTIKHWEPPHENQSINDETRKEIIEHVLKESAKHGYNFEFE